MPIRNAIQIFNGPGAGNIGDELMMHGMWANLPEELRLHVFLHENSRGQRQPYPPQHTYTAMALPPAEFELDGAADVPGLLAGTTVITDVEGWEWPLGFLAPRMDHFTRRGLPVDAVGVGCDFLITPQGRQLFTDSFRGVRSWTVRNQVSADALIDAGVEPSRVAVGADWAWLYETPLDYGPWAAEFLQSLGVRVGEPLLIVNLFWQGQGLSLPIWGDIARTLDRMHTEAGLQIAFFCNEVRHPGFDRTAVEAIQTFMKAPSIAIPNHYFAPGEAIALLRHATATLGQRYHFCVESVLAETVPVNMGRSPKTAGLCEELGLPSYGSLASIDPDELAAGITAAIGRRGEIVADLQSRRHALARRARRNLDLLRLFYGYAAGA